MQAQGAARGGVGTTPRRGGRLEVLVAIAAIVVIVAVVALMVWVVPLATSGVGAEDAISKASAGSAIIHDDAGNLPMDAERAAFYQMRQGAVKNTGIMHVSMVRDMRQMWGTDPGKVAPLNAGAGSAIVHDDTGIMHASMVKDVGHDDAGNMPATGAGAAVIHDDAGNVR